MPSKNRDWSKQHIHTCAEKPSDFCNACYQSEYRIKNREHLIKDSRLRYKRTKEDTNAARRKKYREDAEHRQKIYERGQRYYKANKVEIIKREKRKARGNPGGSRRVYWEMVISLLRQRDGDNCGLCGKHVDIKEASIDHINEMRKIVDHRAENIRLTHRECNMRRPRIEYKPHNYRHDIN